MTATAMLSRSSVRTASFAPPPVFPPRRLALPMPGEDDDAARDAALCARFEEEERLRADAECDMGCDWMEGPLAPGGAVV